MHQLALFLWGEITSSFTSFVHIVGRGKIMKTHVKHLDVPNYQRFHNEHIRLVFLDAKRILF